MLRIGFDVDEVLALTAQSMFDILQTNGKIPKDMTIYDIGANKWEYNPETGTGIPGLSFENLKEIFMQDGYWLNAHVNAGMAEAVRKVAEVGEVYLVTDRRWYPELKDTTAVWAMSNNIPFEDVIISKGKEKGDVAQSLGLHMFVDDSPQNIAAVSPHVICAYMPYGVLNHFYTGELPMNSIACTGEQFMEDIDALLELSKIDSESRLRATIICKLLEVV